MQPSKQVQWLSEIQADLKSQLLGFWSQDEWDIRECPLTNSEELNLAGGNRKIRFSCSLEALNTELKYACWQKLVCGDWQPQYLWKKHGPRIHRLIGWLNQESIEISSFLDISLEKWEILYRSHLIETGIYNRRDCKRLTKEQQVKNYEFEDFNISLIRQVYKTLADKTDERSEFEKDIWDLRKLGVSLNKSRTNYSLNFTQILQPWLREYAKRYVKYCLVRLSAETCINKIQGLNKFSRFLANLYPSAQAADINQALVVNFLAYTNSPDFTPSTRRNSISTLRAFLEFGIREEWKDFTQKQLVYIEDLPKQQKKLPRYIPEEVLMQLNQHIESLQPDMMRMLLVLQATGRRISEICTLNFDCLRQDAQGDWFLFHYQRKMKKEDIVPIAKETAIVIQEQQQFVINEWGNDFPYLFPVSKPYGKGQPIKQYSFAEHINWLAREKNICDVNGRLWRLQAHQFRHTLGTSMINNGVPIHVVSRYLGHTSLEMTLTYAHIHDQTLKKEFVKFQGKLVDVTGKVVEVDELNSANDIDLQWFKRNVQAQALPNGSCALPAPMKECPHANACLTCTHFRTTIEFLDQHKEQLEQTEKIIDKAKVNGWQRQVEMNERVANNLQNIIHSLEAVNGN